MIQYFVYLYFGWGYMTEIKKDQSSSGGYSPRSLDMRRRWTPAQTFGALIRGIELDANKTTCEEKKVQLGRWYIFLTVLHTLSLPAFIGHSPLLLHGSMGVVWWAVVIEPLDIADIRQLLLMLDPGDLDLYWLENYSSWLHYKLLLNIHSGGCLKWISNESRPSNRYGGIPLPYGWKLFCEEISFASGKHEIARSVFDRSMHIPKVFCGASAKIDIKMRESACCMANAAMRVQMSRPITCIGDELPVQAMALIRRKLPTLREIEGYAFCGTHFVPPIFLQTSNQIPPLIGDKGMCKNLDDTLSKYIGAAKHGALMETRGVTKEEVIPNEMRLATRDFVRYIQKSLMRGVMPVQHIQGLGIPLWALSHDGTPRLFGLMAMWYVGLLRRIRDMRRKMRIVDPPQESSTRRRLWTAVNDLESEVVNLPIIKKFGLRRLVDLNDYDDDIDAVDVYFRTVDSLGKRVFDWYMASTSFRKTDGGYSVYDVIEMEEYRDPERYVIFGTCQHPMSACEVKANLSTYIRAIKLGVGMIYTGPALRTAHNKCSSCRTPVANAFGAARCIRLAGSLQGGSSEAICKRMIDKDDACIMPLFGYALLVLPGLVCMDLNVKRHMQAMRKNRVEKMERACRASAMRVVVREKPKRKKHHKKSSAQTSDCDDIRRDCDDIRRDEEPRVLSYILVGGVECPTEEVKNGGD